MSDSMQNENIKMMICSVGGAPQQILYSLKAMKPRNVIFYCSTSTINNVNDFIRECPFIEKQSVIETENWEDFDENLKLLYKEIPKHLARRQVSWDEVLVDYTGGTKTMGAALVLSTVDKGVQYAYVSGNERSKEGVGVVIDGTEKMILIKSNPWDSIAYQQRKYVASAFNFGRYEEALQLATKMKNYLSDNSPWKAIFNGLIPIIEGYQDWDKFRHKRAIENIRKGISQLSHYRYFQKSIEDLLIKVEQNTFTLQLFNSNDETVKSRFIIEDLIANAFRRGEREQKYDDAVARLYRTLELIAQTQLQSKYEINTGKCLAEQIPEAIREEYMRRYWDEDQQCLKFGLHASFNLLHVLQDELGTIYENKKEDIFKRLTLRNMSILAHGLHPVTEKGYRGMLEIVLELAQINQEELTAFPNMEL